MTEKKKTQSGAAETIAELDSRLNGLLGALGSSLSDVLERLEDAGSAEFHRAHDIDTPHGPLRAETGVRVRFAGEEVGQTASAKPVNTPRKAANPPKSPPDETIRTPDQQPVPPSTAKPPLAPRTPDLVSYTSGGTWFLCADLPGVSPSDLQVDIDPSAPSPAIRIETRGDRHYAAEHLLPPQVDPATMTFELRNGVLEIALSVSLDEEPSE